MRVKDVIEHTVRSQGLSIHVKPMQARNGQRDYELTAIGETSFYHAGIASGTIMAEYYKNKNRLK
jgi:hypothetical protein